MKITLTPKLFQPFKAYENFPFAESWQDSKGEFWHCILEICGPDKEGFTKILHTRSKVVALRNLKHQIKGASPICPKGVTHAAIWWREKPTNKSPHLYSRMYSDTFNVTMKGV